MNNKISNTVVRGTLGVALMGVGNSAFGIEIFDVEGVHSHTTSREFDLGSVQWQAKDWNGRVYAKAFAHGGPSAAPYFKNGIKLSYAPPGVGGGTLGSFTQGTISQSANVTEGPCHADGSSTLTGSAAVVGFFSPKLVGKAKSVFIANVAPVAHPEGSASFIGETWDPWDFGIGGFMPIYDGLDFKFELPPEFRAQISGGTWNASFSALIKNAAIDDVDIFHQQSNPEPLYTVACGQNSTGMWADVTLGNPIGVGIPVLWDHTEAQMEQTLLTALNNQTFSSDQLILSGAVDLRGVPSATIGYHDKAEAFKAVAVPEPASILAMALGLGILARRRHK